MEQNKFALVPHQDDGNCSSCNTGGTGVSGGEEKRRLSGTIGVPGNIVSKLDRLMTGMAQRKEEQDKQGKREREQQEGIRKTLADLGAKLDALTEHVMQQQHEIKA